MNKFVSFTSSRTANTASSNNNATSSGQSNGGSTISEENFGSLQDETGLLRGKDDLELINDDLDTLSFTKAKLVNPEWSNEDRTDEVIQELPPEKVRWFYKNFSDKLWTEFNGYDSLKIENKFRKLTREELKIFSTSVRDLKPTSPVSFDSPKHSFEQNAKVNDNDESESVLKEKIVVRGGLYEVDLLQKTCASIFWPGEESVVTRGSWFYETNWQPLELETCECIERVHLQRFAGQRVSDTKDVLDATRPTRKAIFSEPFSDFSVDWYGPRDVYLFSRATPTKIVRSFTQKLGGYFHKTTGTRLLRGYKEIATDVDKPKDITHLVFVVHGIGQKMDIGGRILQNTALLRQTVLTLHERQFSSSGERAEFFPVEWRMSLQLDCGLVEAITPMNVVPLRNFLNSTAMDIMYYTSPIYSAEIQQGLINELNRLYTLYVQRNPTADTKVSIVAHSLGCVIVYDIITGWMPQNPFSEHTTPADRSHILTGKSRLKFEVENFFCLGSPLSVFLALRYPRGQHGYHLFPPNLCRRLYNIFHLSDPVAYRLEPLVVRDYSKIAPIQIRPYNSSHRVPYSELPLEIIVNQETVGGGGGGSSNSASSPSSAPSASVNVPSSTSSSTPSASESGMKEGGGGGKEGVREEGATTVSPTETPVRERGWSIWSLVRGHKNQDGGTSSPQQVDSPTQGLEHRLDYVLRSSVVGISYWSAMTSHTGYWNNPDVAYFILTQIFPNLELESSSSTVASSPSPSPGEVSSVPLLTNLNLAQEEGEEEVVVGGGGVGR
ncbi:phospholipase DDHD1 [Nilaparvata lugens]|uniref:phospholipase DDHD1 n=1 Tax=Nilaparvata lugens TaxID=108931 RepID=UPI00193DC2C3|nr:phospholipase DDHD1 [Nilaparvata lugens]